MWDTGCAVGVMEIVVEEVELGDGVMKSMRVLVGVKVGVGELDGVVVGEGADHEVGVDGEALVVLRRPHE